jgi:choline kinase
VLRKAVIPAAGLGTRLLSVTKEQPKEMVFAKIGCLFWSLECLGLVLDEECFFDLAEMLVACDYSGVGLSCVY